MARSLTSAASRLVDEGDLPCKLQAEVQPVPTVFGRSDGAHASVLREFVRGCYR